MALDQLTPTESFRQRMREARTNAGMTQAQLAERLRAIGYSLSRAAIADIENGRRGVSLDDALAIAAALDVAPVNLIVPFENPEPISEDAARLGIFKATAELAIGEHLTLLPSSARAWIGGTAIHLDAPLSAWSRFYFEEIPPAARYRLEQIRAAFREGRKPDWWPLPEEVRPKMAAWIGGDFAPLDVRVWTLLGITEEDEPTEEENDA